MVSIPESIVTYVPKILDVHLNERKELAVSHDIKHGNIFDAFFFVYLLKSSTNKNDILNRILIAQDVHPDRWKQRISALICTIFRRNPSSRFTSRFFARKLSSFFTLFYTLF